MVQSALITGGAGFIGSHLVRRLCSDGCTSIVALDSLEFGSWDNLDDCDSEVQKVSRDLSEIGFDEMVGMLEGVEVLFHLAAQKHTYRRDSAEKFFAANVIATERLFRAAATAEVRRIVFTSSLFAYGRLSGPPMAETDEPIPSTVYGVSKLAGEGLLRVIARETGVETVSLRLFFIYGPRQFVGLGYPSVIIRTFDRLLQGKVPTLYGDGLQALDYVYIDDAIDALLASATTPHIGEIFNVGSGEAVQVRDLIATASDIAAFRGKPEVMPPDWTAGTTRLADPRKSSELLDWRTTTPLHRGLEQTYQWMKTRA